MTEEMLQTKQRVAAELPEKVMEKIPESMR